MKQDTQKAGKVLVDKLLRLIEGETASDMLLPTELVIRKSS